MDIEEKEKLDKHLNWEKERRYSFINQRDDWKKTEQEILRESREEKYKDYSIIDEIWKGDRKVLKIYSMPQTDYSNTGWEVEVLYVNSEKVEETYYTLENMNDYNYNHFSSDIDSSTLDPKKQEKIFKYKDNELIEFIEAPDDRYDGINTFRFISSITTTYFKNDKIVKQEYSYNCRDIDTIYKFEDNKIEYISINRDYETNYITSEWSQIMYFYNGSTMKEMKAYENNQLLIEVYFDEKGNETNKIVYNEDWRDYL